MILKFCPTFTRKKEEGKRGEKWKVITGSVLKPNIPCWVCTPLGFSGTVFNPPIALPVLT